MHGSTWIKICGVTLPEDLDWILAAGVDAIGLNFIPRSKRRVDIAKARQLATLAAGRLEVVGVIADLEEGAIRELMEVVGLDKVQLHGDEPDELLERLGTVAYKAVGVSVPADVRRAESVPGQWVLVDAQCGNVVGGTGKSFDWSLVSELCRSRTVIVAGGLRPDNAADAVAQLSPFGLDVASGVEIPDCPGRKSESLVRAMVQAVRAAELLNGDKR